MAKKMVIMLVMLALVIISAVYAYQGVAMHQKVSVEEAKFHALQDDYYNTAKVLRDAAQSNSELTGQLVEIQNYPSELLRLKLVGVGKILSGIFLLLLVIALELFMMPMKLGMIIKGKKK